MGFMSQRYVPHCCFVYISEKNNYLTKIPMMRFGDPKDIANLVYFLSSDNSSYITGQNFHVNGGMLMV